LIIFLDKVFSNNAETMRDNARDTKEKCCYVVADFEAEMKSFNDKENKEKAHRMPDGNEIHLGNQIFRCPEALF